MFAIEVEIKYNIASRHAEVWIKPLPFPTLLSDAAIQVLGDL